MTIVLSLLHRKVRWLPTADFRRSTTESRRLRWGMPFVFGLVGLLAGCGSPPPETTGPETHEPVAVSPQTPTTPPHLQGDWLIDEGTPGFGDPWAESPSPDPQDTPLLAPQPLEPAETDRLPWEAPPPAADSAERSEQLLALDQQPEFGPRWAPRMSAMRAPEPSPQVSPLLPEIHPTPDISVHEFPAEDWAATPQPYDPSGDMPVGVEQREAEGYTIVPVFYGTDRQRAAQPLTAYRLVEDAATLTALAASALIALLMAGFFMLRRRHLRALAALTATATLVSLTGYLVWQGRFAVDKEGVAYTGGRGELVRGRCLVTVPDTHERGKIERPIWHRLEVTEDLRRHMVVVAAHELPDSEFHRQLAEAVAAAEHRDLFVFIHGYNVDFESAVRRTAQIAVDLPFRGVPVCYSWPSQGSLLGYTVDENNVTWTVSHLKQFLMGLVAHSQAESINLVAHSMGNRALTAALREFSLEKGAAAEMFDRVVLAAPDVDADHFRRDLAPHLLNAARHVTLYASSGDRALIASKQVHGYPRAGESGPEMVVLPGIETIDVSGIDLSLLGHSYYGESQPLLHDLFHIVRKSLPAAQRTWLQRREYGALEYWQLPGTTATVPINTLR